PGDGRRRAAVSVARAAQRARRPGARARAAGRVGVGARAFGTLRAAARLRDRDRAPVLRAHGRRALAPARAPRDRRQPAPADRLRRARARRLRRPARRQARVHLAGLPDRARRAARLRRVAARDALRSSRVALDLSSPPPLGRTRLHPFPGWLAALGPGIVWMALAQGSGELIWWPYLTAKYGLGFLVLLTPACLVQYPVTYAIGRYSMLTGESVWRGFARVHPAFCFVLWLLMVVAFLWFGAFASAGGT